MYTYVLLIKYNNTVTAHVFQSKKLVFNIYCHMVSRNLIIDKTHIINVSVRHRNDELSDGYNLFLDCPHITIDFMN